MINGEAVMPDLRIRRAVSGRLVLEVPEEGRVKNTDALAVRLEQSLLTE